ncbi:ABC-three component system middle component 1, partial [Yersinia enterocolitica]
MKLLSNNYDLKFLASEFEEAKFDLLVSDDSLCYLSCIVCTFNTSEEVISNWKDVQSLVSGCYQTPNELARWNIYIIFFCKGDLSVWDKYVIENDKYSARKIVIDGIKAHPNKMEIEEVLNNYLLGEDLHLKEVHAPTKIESHSKITKAIAETPLGGAYDSKLKRAEI